MVRAAESKNIRITPELWDLLVERMEKDHRRGSLNSYAEEVLYNWVNNIIVEWERERPRLELQLRQELDGGKKVYAVGPAKAFIERDEGKRKAS